MKYDPKMQWYLAYLIQCFVPHKDFERRTSDQIEKYEVWQNMYLIQASSPDEAYDKALDIGEELNSVPDKPERDFTEFRGVSDLVPVYEELGDGSEITFWEHEFTPRELEDLVPDKNDLTAFTK